MKILRQPDTNICTFVAPSGGVVKGVPILIGGIVVMPVASAAEAASFLGHTRGVIKLPKATGALVAGRWVKWDVSAGNVSLYQSEAADFNVGRTRVAAGSSDTHVEVVLSDRLRKSRDVQLSITDVAAVSDSAVKAAPFAGLITRTWSQLLGGAINGDAALAPKIGSTAITGGGLTLTASGSAAGDIDVAYPTALNVVAFGDSLVVSSDGGGSTTRVVDAYMTIEEL